MPRDIFQLVVVDSRAYLRFRTEMAENIATGMSELALDKADHVIMLNVSGSKVPCNTSVARKMASLTEACRKDEAGRFNLDLDPQLVSSVIKYISTGSMHHLLPACITDSPMVAIQQLGVDLQLPELQQVLATLKHSAKPAGEVNSGEQLEVWDAAAALVLGLQDGTYQPKSSSGSSSSPTSSGSADAEDVFKAFLQVASHPSTFNSGTIAWVVQAAEQHAPFLSREQVDMIASSALTSSAPSSAAAAAAASLSGPSSSHWYDIECESDESDLYDSAESSSDYYDAASDQES